MDAGHEENLALPVTRAELDREAEAWFANGRYVDFLFYMDKHHRDEIHRFLVLQFRLSVEDAQDCYAMSVEALLKAVNDRRSVSRPIGYVFTAARFNAIDLVQTLKQRRVSALSADQLSDGFSADPSELEESDVEIHQEECDSENIIPICGELENQLAVIIVEDADSSAEVEEEWAVVLVREALSYLTRTERQVVELLLGEPEFDFEKNQHVFSSTDAQARLGINHAAFRKAKSRAFKRLRVLIPEIIKDLAIQLPTRAEESIFDTSWDGPSTDIEP